MEKDPPIKDELADALVSLFDGTALHELDFPALTTGEETRAFIVRFLETFELAHRAAVSQKEAVARVAHDEKEARAHLKKLKNLVDGSFVHNDEPRSAFFPTGPGHHTSAEFLTSMLAGHAKYPLPNFAKSGLSVESIAELIRRLGTTTSIRIVKGTQKDATAIERQNMLGDAKSLRAKLRSNAIAVFGDSDKRLVDFGLTPRKTQVRRRKKSDPAAPGTPGGSNPPGKS